MARPKKSTVDILAPEQEKEPKNELLRLWTHVQDNPRVYVAGVVFVAVCILAGVLIRANIKSSGQEITSRYASAAEETDPALRVTKLEEASKNAGSWTAEILYSAGEAAIQAQQYDKARQNFEKVRDQHKDSAWYGRALDGLAWLEENAGNYEAAVKGYEEVVKTDGFIGLIRFYDIGRLQQKLGHLAESAKAYQDQIDKFPDSGVAGKAKTALDKLKLSNPELFPEEKKAEELAPAPSADASVAPAAEAAPATPAPAAEAPAPAGS